MRLSLIWQVFALQAEALLKLQRHDEADAVLNSTLKFDLEALTQLFGTTQTAYVQIIRAQIDMASGRLVSPPNTQFRAC